MITNCSNNYGPYQFPEELIPLVALNVLDGRPLPIYGDGRNVRDWLFVEDRCSAVERVFEAGRPGEGYSIGGDSERTNLEMVEAICRVVRGLQPDSGDPASRITFVADRPGHDRRYAIDASNSRNELDWGPSVELEEGLAATVRRYAQNPGWVGRVTAGVYRRERLGLSKLGANRHE